MSKMPRSSDGAQAEFLKNEIDTWTQQLRAGELCAENERELLKKSFNQIKDGLGDVLSDIKATKK